MSVDFEVHPIGVDQALGELAETRREVFRLQNVVEYLERQHKAELQRAHELRDSAAALADQRRVEIDRLRAENERLKAHAENLNAVRNSVVARVARLEDALGDLLNASASLTLTSEAHDRASAALSPEKETPGVDAEAEARIDKLLAAKRSGEATEALRPDEPWRLSHAQDFSSLLAADVWNEAIEAAALSIDNARPIDFLARAQLAALVRSLRRTKGGESE